MNENQPDHNAASDKPKQAPSPRTKRSEALARLTAIIKASRPDAKREEPAVEKKPSPKMAKFRKLLGLLGDQEKAASTATSNKAYEEVRRQAKSASPQPTPAQEATERVAPVAPKAPEIRAEPSEEDLNEYVASRSKPPQTPANGDSTAQSE